MIDLYEKNITVFTVALIPNLHMQPFKSGGFRFIMSESDTTNSQRQHI